MTVAARILAAGVIAVAGDAGDAAADAAVVGARQARATAIFRLQNTHRRKVGRAITNTNLGAMIVAVRTVRIVLLKARPQLRAPRQKSRSFCPANLSRNIVVSRRQLPPPRP